MQAHCTTRSARPLFLLLAALFALLLAACQRVDLTIKIDPNPNGFEIGVKNNIPTPTPSPTPMLELVIPGPEGAPSATFRPIPGYTWDDDDQGVALTANPGTDAYGTVFLLATTVVDLEGRDADELYSSFIDFFVARSGQTVGMELPTTVDGFSGLSVNLNGTLSGRAVIVRFGDEHLFVMVGQGPLDAWQAQGTQDFDTILNSVRFPDAE